MARLLGAYCRRVAWIVAPEDKRHGQGCVDTRGVLPVLRDGQVVVAELVGPPALFGQPVGRIKEVWVKWMTPGWRSK